MRACLPLVVGLLLAGCAHSPGSGAVSLARTEKAATLLKDYALAQCVSRAYEAPKVREDARAAAGAYLEFGQVTDAEAYAEAVALAERFLAKRYDSKSGQPLQLMKCIDLLHSAELDALVRRATEGLE